MDPRHASDSKPAAQHTVPWVPFLATSPHHLTPFPEPTETTPIPYFVELGGVRRTSEWSAHGRTP
jgi:hypothetical protein